MSLAESDRSQKTTLTCLPNVRVATLQGNRQLDRLLVALDIPPSLYLTTGCKSGEAIFITPVPVAQAKDRAAH
jgi:hypothetical protein